MFIKKLILNTVGKLIPSDYFARRYPVSVKGALWIDGKILLLKNERNEWDLPGGKIDSKESIEDCLRREFKEETALDIDISKLQTVKKISIANRIEVLIVLYKCSTQDSIEKIKISFEHKEFGLFSKDSLEKLTIDPILKKSIYSSLLS